MSRRTPRFFYSREDWALMEQALRMAANELGYAPDTPSTARLARLVMILFDEGLRDEVVLARTAAYQHRIIAETAMLRGQAR